MIVSYKRQVAIVLLSHNIVNIQGAYNMAEFKFKEKYDIPTITYTPTETDEFHLKEIRDFFNSENIPYEEDKETYGLFYVNGKQVEIRYIDSYFFPMDNEKRFGEIGKGVPHNYFVDISHMKVEQGIRVIWVFDFEMEQHNTIIVDGKEVEHRRQWEVIKNTIRTCTGHIHHRFFARDFEVKEVDNKELRPFLETNCFYGYRSANKNLGLYLKKDKNGFKKGTLLFVLTFGYNFYGNKKRMNNPFIEIIRASTKLECQVIGGMSKVLTHFCKEYPTLHVGDNDIMVNELIFYCDASHNDGRGMSNSALAFNFVSWQGTGFMNRWTCDYNGKEDNRVCKNGKGFGGLFGKKGEIFHRKPMYHQQIMQLMSEGKIVSIANAGTSVYSILRKDWVHKNCEKWFNENWDNEVQKLKEQGFDVSLLDVEVKAI